MMTLESQIMINILVSTLVSSIIIVKHAVKIDKFCKEHLEDVKQSTIKILEDFAQGRK